MILAASLQIVKVVRDHGRDVESANFRVQLRDALLPLTGVVADLDVDAPHERKPSGYEGSMSGYRTFISVPIWTSGKVFGMITVDSPRANSLVLEDLYVVEMFSEIMSIAFDKGLHSPAEI